MTFEEIHKNYEAQTLRATDEYEKYRTAQLAKQNNRNPVKWDEYTGFSIDYNGLTSDITQALQDEFGFNFTQAAFIGGVAYEKYHAYFDDVISGARNFGNTFKEWDALNSKK